MSNFIEIRHVGTSSYSVQTEERTDGQTHMTKFIAAIRNFANVPENIRVFKICTEFFTEHLVHGVSYWLEYIVYLNLKYTKIKKNCY
jgi:hypothetical protein